MNWSLAHRIASIAAVQAHRDLGIDRSAYVPVHAALGTAGLPAMARNMPTLFGMYVAPRHNGPGILLNAGLDIITQRHTAAHELGHHCLGHGTTYDAEQLDRAQWGDGTWPDHEKLAEAFAAWFLMPRPAVLDALARLGLTQPTGPHHAYLVARHMGTSYAGTLRHLISLRLLSEDVASQWRKVAPSDIKQHLSRGAPQPAEGHVHTVTAAMADGTVHVDVGDRIVLDIPHARFTDVPTGLLLLDERTVEIGEYITRRSLAHITTRHADASFLLHVVHESPRVGADLAWPD